ncbi:MAG: hypothetical protein HOV79_04560 [Hamadaea sp.]|nr:hypothetical protein [Hamadaea sp.]
MRISRAVTNRIHPRLTRRVATAVAAVLMVSAVAGPAAAKPGTPTSPTQDAPSVIGYPAVASPQEPIPGPLPKRSGSVKLDRSTRVEAKDGASLLATPATAKVALRALVVATSTDDFGVPTWTSTLDRVGAAYDVLYTAGTPLTDATLVRADGTGKYNAILLTSTMLLYADSGAYVAGLSPEEWNLLWAYERDFGVRQAALYGSHGTWPEDYCLRPRTEGAVGDTALTATLTADGAGMFDYLNASARIPIVQSYVYRNQLAAGCAAQPILQTGTDVLGVRSTAADGRERAALTFTSNQYLLQAHLLTFGLFRWASKGLYLGDQRHYLDVDVDDWFNSSDEMLPSGVLNSDPGYQMSGHDAYNAHLQQTSLRARYPLASGFTMGMAINGGDANLNAGSQCYPYGGIARLTATTRCLRGQFRWINHTLTHPKMNFTDYATNVTEISSNLDVAARLGLPVDRTVLKTPEYSGLGVYNPDATNDIDPPTDYGLAASNPALLSAATDLGVKYLHGNMSFPSHRPSCFNCVTTHPMASNLSIVPDWPTNIAYFSTTPAEETYFYNSFYGPNGKFPYWPTNLTYNQIISYETDQALLRVASGTSYSTTFHIGNLRDYGNGRTLLTDWAGQLLAKYTSYYSVPLLSPGWPALAAYALARSAHFAQVNAGVDAVYDAAAGAVTVTTPATGTLTLSGARTANATSYGKDLSAQLSLAANTPVTVPAQLTS